MAAFFGFVRRLPLQGIQGAASCGDADFQRCHQRHLSAVAGSFADVAPDDAIFCWASFCSVEPQGPCGIPASSSGSLGSSQICPCSESRGFRRARSAADGSRQGSCRSLRACYVASQVRDTYMNQSIIKSMYVCVYIYTFIRICTYILTHNYVYIYIYIYMNVCYPTRPGLVLAKTALHRAAACTLRFVRATHAQLSHDLVDSCAWHFTDSATQTASDRSKSLLVVCSAACPAPL